MALVILTHVTYDAGGFRFYSGGEDVTMTVKAMMEQAQYFFQEDEDLATAATVKPKRGRKTGGGDRG